MKRFLAALLCVPALALVSVAADAKPFRWASQGDPQTADPHSQNESFTNLFSQSVHDTLVMRDNEPQTRARAGDVVAAGQPDDLALHLCARA